MKLSRGFIITIICIPTILIGLIIIVGPNGTGSIKRCNKLKSDLLALPLEQLKAIYGGSLNIVTCEDGDVIGICDDSHAWFGGNMVVKTSDSEVMTYMGHVCGRSFLLLNFDEYKAREKYENKPINSEQFLIFLKTKLVNARE